MPSAAQRPGKRWIGTLIWTYYKRMTTIWCMHRHSAPRRMVTEWDASTKHVSQKLLDKRARRCRSIRALASVPYYDHFFLHRIAHAVAWFSHALRRYPHALYLAKGDDDAYYHVPNLSALLWTLRAQLGRDDSASVYGGWVQYASYRESDFKMCGWSPSVRDAVRFAHGNAPSGRAAIGRAAAFTCPRPISGSAGGSTVGHAAEGPFPFVAGALELFSHHLARQVFNSSTAVEFVQRARRAAAGGSAPHESRWMNYHEDPTVGYVVQAAARRLRINVTLFALNGFRYESVMRSEAQTTCASALHVLTRSTSSAATLPAPTAPCAAVHVR